jgi:hypothetical protein
LQCATADDGRGNEIAGVWRIDNIHPDVLFSCRLAHSGIHRSLIGGPDHQSTTQHIISAEWPGLIQNGSLRCEGGQCLADSRADNHHLRLGFEQPLYFTSRHFPAADDQATLTL